MAYFLTVPTRSLALLLGSLTLVSACTAPADAPTPPAPPSETTSATDAPTQPRMEAGVQVVNVEAGPMGYAPRSITLQAGVPARLVFTRTVDAECSSQVRVPDFGVPATDLPMHEPVSITFTPDTSGTFTFVCGMDMQRGTLVIQS